MTDFNVVGEGEFQVLEVVRYVVARNGVPILSRRQILGTEYFTSRQDAEVAMATAIRRANRSRPPS